MPAAVDGYFTDRPDDRAIGVLGGMGPHATVDFFGLLVRLTEADKDWNHLHIIVDDNPRIPSRTRALLFDEASPAPYMIAGARRLETMGAGLIVVPCNSASYFLGPVRAAVATPVLDPVQATAAVIIDDERRIRRPFVLGGMVTHRTRLYGAALAGAGIEAVQPDDAEQDEVAALIEALKRLDTGAAIVARTRALMAAALGRGCDAVILGCTEFSLIAEQLAHELPVFNSNDLLARRAVALARAPASPSPSSPSP